MRGLLFVTILLSSAALLASGDLDAVTAARRQASAGKQAARPRGNVRVDEDDSGGSRSLVDESIAPPILVAARNAGRSQLVILPDVRDPFEKRDPAAARYGLESRGDRLVMGNPMFVDEPGFMDITRNYKKTLGNDIQPYDYPIHRGRRIRSGWSTDAEIPEEARQDDRKARIRTTRDSLANHYIFSKGKRRTNYRANAEKLSESRVPWNGEDGDGDWTLATSFGSRSTSGEQDGQLDRASVARKSARSSHHREALLNRWSAPILFYAGKDRRPTVAESTE